MKFWEAAKALGEGKKIRCKCWDESRYIFTGPPFQELYYENKQPVIDFPGVWLLYDWELYEEPEKILSWPDVLKGLKEGKKFKRKKWDKVIRSTSDYGIIFSSELEPCIFCTEDFEATDWIEVQ